MNDQVSVIIPTYNRAESLERAIESVLSQSYSNWQLWVIDDGSTDSTAQLLCKYKNHKQIKLIKTENRGVSAARNKAIVSSQSSLICFLDSDDEWLPQKLSEQVQFMNENPSMPIVHGEEIWIRNGVRVNPMKKHKKSGGDIFAQSLKLCCISPSTVMLRRSIFKEVGLFNEDFPVCEDYDLWLKITSIFKVGFIDTDLIIKYGGHEDQLSRRYKAMDYWRVESIKNLLVKGTLQESQQKWARIELKKKASVLLRGYRKHENLKVYDEIFKQSLF